VADIVVGTGGGFYFMTLLCRLSLDQWQWKLDPDCSYLVGGVYQLLTSQEFHCFGATSDLILHKQVPLKVSIFAWRLLRDMLPTKDNLVARDIIHQEARLSVRGCGGKETRRYLFLSCTILTSFWSLVRSWVGFSSADP
jgi:hypothetical protein